jgi:hypothetical protein
MMGFGVVGPSTTPIPIKLGTYQNNLAEPVSRLKERENPRHC